METVIVTFMNQAWAVPNSTFDVFLESFHAGEGTAKLLRHVVVVCLHEKAYSRCNEIHPRRCLWLRTTGVDFSGEKLFMVPDYLKMMWLRTDLLASFLKLGYNFLFTVNYLCQCIYTKPFIGLLVTQKQKQILITKWPVV